MTFSIQEAAQQAQAATSVLSQLSTQTKNDVLNTMARNLRANKEPIIHANELDIANAVQAGLSPAMTDRLKLDNERIDNIASAIEEIASLIDPVGEVTSSQKRPNGLEVNKIRIPLGVIAMIYESRPNVTADAAALCFKAGNAVVLRGGKEALHSNLAIASQLHAALESHGLPTEAVTVIPDPDRAILTELLTLNQYIDLVIPRGGEGLIHYVTNNSRIPVIQHFKGVCHLYVDEFADVEKAVSLIMNGKTQRPGVCNALESIVVHQDICETLFPQLATALQGKEVTVHACPRSINQIPDSIPQQPDDLDNEYLALEMNLTVVENFDQAIAHIQAHSSGHTEVIVSQDISRTKQFTRAINSSVVMINASSRFSDGGQLGLGAEIGISTSKLHAYGPMGLSSLTTEKFVVSGDGHIRS